MTRLRTRAGLAVGLAVAALAISGCGGDEEAASGDTTDTTDTTETTDTTLPTEPNALSGSVGPGFVISLSGADGAAVTTLAAGSYTIDVNDQSDIHNFHLTGPGVDETTDVAGQGASTFEVDLEAGTYTFVCDPHAGSMTGSFEVS